MRTMMLGAIIAIALVLTLAASGRDSGRVEVDEVLYAHRTDGLVESFRTQVRDRNENAIGYGIWACIRVGTLVSLRECTATLSLPGGDLMLQGKMIYREAFAFAVVGGNGRYEGAAGTGRSERTRPLRWHTSIKIR